MYNNDKSKSKVLPVILNILFTVIGTAVIFLVMNAL